MGDNLEALYMGSKNGDKSDMYKLIQAFDKDLKKRSYIGGRFNEDLYQEMCIKLLKCIKKFEYRSAS
ncbi:helix-turn-helix domain-containing protein [Paramaledivibacter caminithermalis]|jgi:DNA-directed RNA polymerase specialized sigma24 family protein|uniref:Helix-turn-helix domain-containing protein n=1 Tax=Paramaledivibacter caminithermalis (strain DSM 15212 / CIP 107654 / DViRD3) TaxID=1121301 RepID=A0A1M6SN85_PARC5|nr:helix-turn-helix domain-containing protein [Paramaledivibacter caminithermalis]SHK46202.1 Helix-turn-helix domain-containing protein [Paramaledivibacter caminithermalis DSM 15212]